jgi:hypothetical protein
MTSGVVGVGGASLPGGAAVAADMKPLKAPPLSGTFKLHLFRVGVSYRL